MAISKSRLEELIKQGATIWSDVWIDLATEENYIKACDLCLKLFKGE